LRCFHVLFALLLISTTAFGAKPAAQQPVSQVECYPPKAVLNVLLTAGFIPVAEIGIGNLPGLLFANQKTSEYIIVISKDNLLCKVGEGVGFFLIKRTPA